MTEIANSVECHAPVVQLDHHAHGGTDGLFLPPGRAPKDEEDGILIRKGEKMYYTKNIPISLFSRPHSFYQHVLLKGHSLQCLCHRPVIY